MYAVAVGEQFDAINFHGPFVDFDSAEVWADRNSGSTNWWIVQLEATKEEDGLSDLFIPDVDMDTLQEQYVRLQEVITFVENARHGEGGKIPDASILDGIVEMLGDVLPIPEEVE